MKWIAWLLGKYFVWRYDSKQPDFSILGEHNEPYMDRWWIVPRNKYFNVYLHRVVGDDERHFHDHPWNSVGLIIHGAYTEHTPYHQPIDRKLLNSAFKTEVLSTGNIKRRDTSYAHYLMMKTEGPIWSLFFTGPKKGSWGFYDRNTLEWIDHVPWCQSRGKEITY